MRNGKIATLPAEIRDELNLRLEDGEDGGTLLEWLNALPEVQESLKEGFSSVPISKQNLSEWRLGGYREWRLRCDLERHACRLSEATNSMQEVVDIPIMARDLAAALAIRYAAILNTWDGEPDPKLAEKLRLHHLLARDIALLQRAIHQSTRQVTEYRQQLEDETKRDVDAAKAQALNPIWAALRCVPLAKIFGGGESGQKLAELVTSIQYELPRRNLDLATPSDSPAQACPKKRAKEKPSAKPVMPPGRPKREKKKARPAPVAAAPPMQSANESGPVSQEQSIPEVPHAASEAEPPCPPQPGGPALQSAQRGGEPALPGFSEGGSNPVKPIPEP